MINFVQVHDPNPILPTITHIPFADLECYHCKGVIGSFMGQLTYSIAWEDGTSHNYHLGCTPEAREKAELERLREYQYWSV